MTNYAPSIEEVAKTFLMARTRDAHGNLIGTFNDQTGVSADQAQRAIDTAAGEVSEEIGAEVQDDLIDPAKRLTMLLAAANIELSYYPEQSAATNSMYDKLMARYNALLPKIGEDEAEEDISEPEGSELGSFGSFPKSSRWGSRPW